MSSEFLNMIPPSLSSPPTFHLIVLASIDICCQDPSFHKSFKVFNPVTSSAIITCNYHFLRTRSYQLFGYREIQFMQERQDLCFVLSCLSIFSNELVALATLSNGQWGFIFQCHYDLMEFYIFDVF